MPDNIPQKLHDNATRGIALSEHEQIQLDAWYAEQDHIERELLGPSHPSQRLITLQTQLDTTLVQLQNVTQRIQELTAQNDAVRREIAVLQRQLAHTPTP